MKWVRAMIGITVSVSIVLGWKIYSKSHTARQIKQQLLIACAQDDSCSTAIHQHFNHCFDTHYNWASRQLNDRLHGPQFLACIRDNADSLDDFENQLL